MYGALDETVAWTAAALDSVVSKLEAKQASLVSCVQSDSARRRIWTDGFEFAARRLTRTPTVIIDGISVEGELEAQQLISLIEKAVNRRTDGAL